MISAFMPKDIVSFAYADTRWFEGYEWTYDGDLDGPLFRWRIRWWQKSNNPFGEA